MFMLLDAMIIKQIKKHGKTYRLVQMTADQWPRCVLPSVLPAASHTSSPESRWSLRVWVLRMRTSSSTHQQDVISGAGARGVVQSAVSGPDRAAQEAHSHGGGDGG